ncbi:MAG: signal recognition particle-docking protein FtsY [Ottowia sp.]|nr:signal recognition particle-docking protein FtsY [Ottowia sp.]
MFRLIKKHLFKQTTVQDTATMASTDAVENTLSEEIFTDITPPPTEAKSSWRQRLSAGLARTSQQIATLFVGTRVDEDLLEEIESALICADVGITATQNLLTQLRRQIKLQNATTPVAVKQILSQLLNDLLKPLEKQLTLGQVQPLVIMVAGVNGVGKTTSIGKLCQHLRNAQQSILLAAGDTFRAAARDQLMLWGERNAVTVISQEGGDPAAVVFDAINAGCARGSDVVIADTAGRLPTQMHLMEELKKIQRVAARAMPGAPHERVLVIDANNGQNALAQVKAFDEAIGLTGLIVTKLDGTARGGILAAIAHQHPIPVYFIGVGEQLNDLQPFDATTFTHALLGDLTY